MGFFEFLMGETDTNMQNSMSDTTPDVKRLSNLGVIGFGEGITDKNIQRTPHYEIAEALSMFELNIIVSSAVYQLVNFVIPNKTVKIASKDEATVEWLEKWHEQRSTIMEEFKNMLISGIICGNSFMETLYAEDEGKGHTLDNVFSYNDASRIYVNPDVSDDGHDAYILTLPIGIKDFTYRGVQKKIDWYRVRYIKNYQYTMKRVYGCLVSSDELQHWKRGWSRDNIYGRSQLVAAIDANNIMKELMSTWDTVIRTRRKDIKIYSVADAETGKRYSQKQLDTLTEKLQDTASSFKLINIPLKLNESEIKTTGTYDLFEGVFDSVRRMVIMALLPQHLTPWNDSATTQGAESSMPPFLLRIKALQQEFIHFLTTSIIDKLRIQEPMLSKDATYIFDEPIVMGSEYYVRMMTDLVNAGVMNADQMREYLINMGILDATIFDDSINTKNVDGKTDADVDRKTLAKTNEILRSFEQFKKDKKVVEENL